MPSQSTRAKVFVIGESALNREAMRLLLEVEGGFRVVGVAADYAQALTMAPDSRPDLLLLDLAAPVSRSSEALESLTRIAPLIVLMPALDRSDVIRAVGHGVRAVLPKDATTPALLFRCIRVVMSGQYWIDRETVADLVRSLRARGRSRSQKNFGLTTRELDIIAGLAAGSANKEIAKRLAISEKTVKHHLTNIFAKLGVSNRLEVVLFAVQHNLAPSTRVVATPFDRASGRPRRQP